MIFQESLTENQWIWIIILIISLLIMIIFFLLSFLYTYITSKIHKSFHKGYNKAKSDKVKYYATIKTLTDNFDIIIENLKTDNTKPSIITTDLLLRYKDSLKNYYND